MPELVTFHGRPVKHHYATDDGRVLVIFVHPVKGQKGKQVRVSQAAWQAHSCKQYFATGAKPDVRALAAKFQK